MFEEFVDGAVLDRTRGIIEYNYIFLSRPGGHLEIDEEILEGNVEPMSWKNMSLRAYGVCRRWLVAKVARSREVPPL